MLPEDDPLPVTVWEDASSRKFSPAHVLVMSPVSSARHDPHEFTMYRHHSFPQGNTDMVEMRRSISHTISRLKLDGLVVWGGLRFHSVVG